MIVEKLYFADTNTTKVSLFFIPSFCLNKAGCRNAYKFQLMARLVNLSLFSRRGNTYVWMECFAKYTKQGQRLLNCLPSG